MLGQKLSKPTEEKYLRFFYCILPSLPKTCFIKFIYVRINYRTGKIYDAMPLKNSDVIIMR